jgi:tetratricopeptide (TPR) repeat protein/GTPase SAR1 family protein
MAGEPRKPRSIRELRERRERSDFVGREEPLQRFRANLELAGDDDRRLLFFNVSGQGGVGKSTLLRQFAEIAGAQDYAAATVDEKQSTVLDALVRINDELTRQKRPLDLFTERYETYIKKRRLLEASPDAPAGFGYFVAKGLVLAGIGLAGEVPIVGNLTKILKPDELAEESAKAVRTFLQTKLAKEKEEDQRLILNPVEELTPLLIDDLWRRASGRIVLFLDTFEKTGQYLEPWLVEHRDSFPASITIVIAGRQPLDRARWSEFESLLARIELEPFTEAEVREYLERKHVTDTAVVDIILNTSRLPVLVAMLATGNPNDPAAILESAGTAVERFLKWVDDSGKRQLALDSALSPLLNRDVLEKIAGERTEDVFVWLKEMPFLLETADGWRYDSTVRAQMLRYKRREAPDGWNTIHEKLARYHEELRDRLGLQRREQWASQEWQTHELASLYHRLCRSPQGALPAALQGFVRAWHAGGRPAERWANCILEAGRDAESRAVESWGNRLAQAVKARVEDNRAPVIAALTELAGEAELDAPHRAMLLDSRGEIYMLEQNHPRARADFAEAARLQPDSSEYRTDLGWCLWLMGQNAEALVELTNALDQEPDSIRALRLRGLVNQSLRKYADAVPDFDRLVELEPVSPARLSGRAYAKLLAGDFAGALVDLEHSIELDPNNLLLVSQKLVALIGKGDGDAAMQTFTALAKRAQEYFDQIIKAVGQTPDAVFESVQQIQSGSAIPFNAVEEWKAISADLPNATNVLQAQGAFVEGQMKIRDGDLEGAAECYGRAIGLKPAPGVLVARASLLQLLGRRDEAKDAVNRAIEMNPSFVPAIVTRGKLRMEENDLDGALADFDLAVALDPENLVLQSTRVNVFLRKGETDQVLAIMVRLAAEADRYVQGLLRELSAMPPVVLKKTLESVSTSEGTAATAFLEMVRQDPSRAARLLRAEVADEQGRRFWKSREFDQAIESATRAVTEAPENAMYVFRRGVYYYGLDRWTEALPDLTRSIDLDSSSAIAYEIRGLVHRGLGNPAAAIADFGRALEIDRNDMDVLKARGELFWKEGELDKALADYDRIAGIDTQSDAAQASRGAILNALGRPEEALEAIERAEQLGLAGSSLMVEKGRAFVDLRRLPEALAEFDRAAEALAKDGADSGAEAALVRALRGETFQLLGDHPNAVAELDQAVALEPDNETFRFVRHCSLRANADNERANEDLVEALRLTVLRLESRPGDTELQLRLANYRLAAGDPQTAEAGYREALRRAPQHQTRQALQAAKDLLRTCPEVAGGDVILPLLERAARGEHAAGSN